MAADQLECWRVIEPAQLPTGIGDLVADLTIGGEPGKDVIGHLSVGEFVQVTALAIDWGEAKFVALLVDVAVFATRRRMGTYKREKRVLVVGDHGNAVVPALRIVTGDAIVAQAALVNVRVAVVASGSYIFEGQVLVAGGAFTVEVIAEQCETRGAVVELAGIDGVPVGGRVANGTTQIQVTMGVFGRNIVLGQKQTAQHGHKQGDDPEDSMIDHSPPPCLPWVWQSSQLEASGLKRVKLS